MSGVRSFGAALTGAAGAMARLLGHIQEELRAALLSSSY